MKINYFTKYTRKGASSRLRSFQYEDNLKMLGAEPHFYPLFSDSYLKAIYNKKTPIFSIIKGYLKRLKDLICLNTEGVLIVEKELFPYLPFFIERLLVKKKQLLVLDFDDAIFHNYDLHSNLLVKFLLKKKIDKLMSMSTLVVVCNEYLKKRALQAGARKVVVIPTVVDLNHYTRNTLLQKRNEVVLGWIGSPTTFKYLKNIEDVLEKAIDELKVRIHVVGAKERLKIEKNVHYFEWSEQGESALIQNFDVGLMPLEKTSWAEGKCAYKLIQYMACGKPVIASPVGMNKKVVKPNENGLFAQSDTEWLEAIRVYVENPALISAHGINGFQLVENDFNLQKSATRLHQVLNELKNKPYAS